MPDAELFTVEEVLLDPPLAGIISRPGLRTKCDRCGKEIINARQMAVGEETLCAACAGIGYYRGGFSPNAFLPTWLVPLPAGIHPVY